MSNRLCKDCLHCKSKQTGVVTFRYWCEITKVGVRPWMEKPHPKARSRVAGRDALKVKIQSVTLIFTSVS